MSERTGDAQPAVTPPQAPSDRPIEVADTPFNLTEDPTPTGTPKAKPRTRTILLAALLAIAVAAAAASAITGWRILSQKDATLAAPVELAGLKIDDSPDGQATADYLTTALAAEVELDKTVGAVYRNPAAPEKGILVFGGTALIWTPSSDLEKAFELIADDQGAVTDIHDVEAGALSGSMKCGKTETADGPMSVCGWADHGSLALALFPGRPEAEAADLLRKFRDTAQTRN